MVVPVVNVVMELMFGLDYIDHWYSVVVVAVVDVDE